MSQNLLFDLTADPKECGKERKEMLNDKHPQVIIRRNGIRLDLGRWSLKQPSQITITKTPNGYVG